MNFEKYHVSRNLIDIRDFTATTNPTSQNGVLWTGTLAEGTYTFSINQDDVLTSSTRNTIHIKIGSTNYYENVSVNYHNNSGRHSYTFTVPDATTMVEIRYWTNAISNDCSFSQGMLNTGSEALPYEPYSSEVWHDIPHYIHKTDTDTITTLPVVLYPTGTTATVGLKGQSVQSTTPTPDNPIMPQGTGERTANLFDYQTMAVSLNDYYLIATGQEIALSGWRISDYVPCNGKEFTINKIGGNTPAICLYDENKQFLTGKSYQTGGTANKIPVTISSDTNAKYIRFSYVTLSDDLSEITITEGTTAPSERIPYGYKIPISSAGQTTPIYLGEVETTRRIKKLVLTGEENWYVEGNDIFYTDPITEAVRQSPICSHFIGVYTLSGNNQITISQSLRINILTATITHTASDFKTYLAQQYTAGTPVTVWYVLATETTGIVNEPLMKIGDYADTVSGITIPTIAGANTLSVGTTLQPSEVTVNYKGWHPVQSVHEAENGQWD